MKRRTVLSMAMFLAALVRPVQTLSKATQERSRTSSPVSFTIFSECSNELIDVQGQITTIIKSTDASSGGTHLSFDFIVDGTGVGQTSGKKYKVSQTFSSRFNDNNPSSCQFELNSTQALILIGQGPSDNLTVHFTMHITINSNCAVTSSVSNFRSACLGQAGKSQV